MTNPLGDRRSREAKPEQPNSRERLLTVGLAQFAERGLDGASTRDIALAAGTVMSSITYHFGSKADLYIAVKKKVGDALAGIVRREIASCRTLARASHHEAISSALGVLVDYMLDPTNVQTTLFAVQDHLSESNWEDPTAPGPVLRVTRDLAEALQAVPGITLPPVTLAALLMAQILSATLAIPLSRRLSLQTEDRSELATIVSATKRLMRNLIGEAAAGGYAPDNCPALEATAPAGVAPRYTDLIPGLKVGNETAQPPRVA